MRSRRMVRRLNILMATSRPVMRCSAAWTCASGTGAWQPVIHRRKHHPNCVELVPALKHTSAGVTGQRLVQCWPAPSQCAATWGAAPANHQLTTTDDSPYLAKCSMAHAAEEAVVGRQVGLTRLLAQLLEGGYVLHFAALAVRWENSPVACASNQGDGELRNRGLYCEHWWASELG